MSETNESPTWPTVERFAHTMERKLADNRHKGDREGWLAEPPRRLMKLLNGEVDELHKAVLFGDDPEAVAKEAADVANFAMMVADSFASRAVSDA